MWGKLLFAFRVNKPTTLSKTLAYSQSDSCPWPGHKIPLRLVGCTDGLSESSAHFLEGLGQRTWWEEWWSAPLPTPFLEGLA